MTMENAPSNSEASSGTSVLDDGLAGIDPSWDGDVRAMTAEQLRTAVATLRVEIVRRGHVELQLREWLLILRGRLLHADPTANTADVDKVLLPANAKIRGAPAALSPEAPLD